jgi:hypothetical protein
LIDMESAKSFFLLWGTCVGRICWAFENFSVTFEQNPCPVQKLYPVCMLGEKWKNCTLIWYYPCHLHDFVMLEYHWLLFFASFADFDILLRPNRCGARSAHWRISYSSEFWSLKDQPLTQSKETVDSWIFTFNTREPEVL